MANLIGREILDNIQQRTQVYQATHDGEGNSLPYLSRSFISFTFGGKAIEDFGLIVTTSDRIERAAYTPFSDITSSYDTLNGQLYWGTKYEPNQLSLTLSTDEMSDRQLDDFREWFAPGENRELILAEHPNRAIMARVSEPPAISMIPFEKKVDSATSGIVISTTVYKGDISITFVMDEPIWYGILSYMPEYIDKNTLEILDYNNSDNINKVTSSENKDMLKIMLEDGIPHQSVLIGNHEDLTSDETFFLGNNLLVTKKALVSDVSDSDQAALTDTIHARVSGPGGTLTRLGVTVNESNGLTVSSSSPQYLFYSGTAKSYPTIKFTITPQFDFSEDKTYSGYTARYVKSPKNSFSTTDYSYIKIRDKYFYFTTPAIITSVNKALSLFKKFSLNTSCEDLITLVKENIPERYARAWAIACINSLKDGEGHKITVITTQPQKLFLLNNMMAFLVKENSVIPNLTVSDHDSTLTNSVLKQMTTAQNNESLLIYPMTFTINSKTGEAIGNFTVRMANSNGTIDSSSFITIEQNVGDMVCSDYLTIEGRDYLDNFGINLANCHKITSNESLTNVLVFFKNMYL